MELPHVIFTNGSEYFSKLSHRYTTHRKGLFIMTPSGAGKTYFCNRQATPEWIDGDVLWIESGAQPAIEWWNGGVPIIERVEQRCDVITAQAVDMGLWVMGSVNSWLKPDAIVIPKWETLVEHIHSRQVSGNYDGGLTDSNLEQLKTHLSIINKWHTDYGVPKFESIEEATSTLAAQVE